MDPVQKDASRREPVVSAARVGMNQYGSERSRGQMQAFVDGFFGHESQFAARFDHDWYAGRDFRRYGRLS